MKMEKRIKEIKIPKCKKCKKLMEVRVTTEQDKKSKGKLEVIIFLGVCEKCNIMLVFDLIQTKDLPSNPKELMDALEKRKKKGGVKK